MGRAAVEEAAVLAFANFKKDVTTRTRWERPESSASPAPASLGSAPAHLPAHLPAHPGRHSGSWSGSGGRSPGVSSAAQHLGALLSLPHAAPSLTLPEGACLPVGHLSPWIAAPAGPGRTHAGPRQTFRGGFDDRFSISLQRLPRSAVPGSKGMQTSHLDTGRPMALQQRYGQGGRVWLWVSAAQGWVPLWNWITTLPAF